MDLEAPSSRERRATMSGKMLRTLRKDMTIITSLALLGLVGLSVLSGMGMDDVEGLLPVDDIHALLGYTMAIVAGAHAILHLGTMRTYAVTRLKELAGRPADDRPVHQQATRGRP
jgi:hypothetical protein